MIRVWNELKTKAAILLILAGLVIAGGSSAEFLHAQEPAADAAGWGNAQAPAVPESFASTTEEAYFNLLRERILREGLSSSQNYDEGWYAGNGIVWAEMAELSGEGEPEFAILSSELIYPGETDETDILSYSLTLDIYNIDSGKANLLYTTTYEDYNIMVRISEYMESPCIETSADLGTRYMIQNGSVSTESFDSDDTADVNVMYYDTGSLKRVGYSDEMGRFINIDERLYETITRLSGHEPGEANASNEDWKALYDKFLHTLPGYYEDYAWPYDEEPDDINIESYAFTDLNNDGKQELLTMLCMDLEDEPSYLSIAATADDHCLRILQTRTEDMWYRDSAVCIYRESPDGWFTVYLPFTLSDHGFQAAKGCFYSDSDIYPSTSYYLIDPAKAQPVKISEDAYDEAVEKHGFSAYDSDWTSVTESDSDQFTIKEQLEESYPQDYECPRPKNEDPVASEHIYYLNDNKLNLQAGSQVPGSEDWTDMNTAFAGAIRLLADRYGIAAFKESTETEIDPFLSSSHGMQLTRAALFGSNAEGNPYLVIGRNYGEDGVSDIAYVFSWEKDKLIFLGVPVGFSYYLAVVGGRAALISDDDCGGCCVFYLDGTDSAQFYGEHFPDDWDEDSEEESYYIGDHYGSGDELYRKESYLYACRAEWGILRGYMTEDGLIKYLNASLDDVYRQCSGGESLMPGIASTITWKEYYRRIIDLFSSGEDARFSLLYLDDDEIPELIIELYMTGTSIVYTCDDMGVESARMNENAVLCTKDRCGSFILMEENNDYEAYNFFPYALFGISAGRITLTTVGQKDEEFNLYVWNGIEVTDSSALFVVVTGAIPGAVLFYPSGDLTTILELLDTFTSSTILTVNSSWPTATAYTFRLQWVTPEDTSGAEESEAVVPETEAPYTGPADLANAQADWAAVNAAGMLSGDPITVPGDYYTDSQERYKETGYILPQSATQYLTEEDIAHLTMKGCCYARNEIYARYGRRFNSNELQTYFDSRSWYDGHITPDEFTEEYTKSVFNEYEYANAYFLLQYENEHGMYWPQ